MLYLKTIILYFGKEARGDLNREGKEDVVFRLTQDNGGSGTFYYVSAVLADNGTYRGLNASLLGDRIAPQTTEIKVDFNNIIKFKFMKKKSNVGLGLAGLAAGAYFFLGPEGKKHQKNLKSWVIKMKGDVIEKLEKARDISEPIYKEIIDNVAAKHKKRMKDGEEEVSELAQDLKKHWKTISNSAKEAKDDIVKDSVKIVKKINTGKKKLLAKEVKKPIKTTPKKK